MLRKLFIGLLILSALTSKSTGSEITDTPERFSPESFLSMCGDKWLAQAEAAGAREIILSKGISGFMGGTLVPFGEFHRVKSLEQHIYCSIGDSTTYKSQKSYRNCTKTVYSSYSRNMVSSGTDTSPPTL